MLGNRRISCITEILIQKAANSLIDDFGYSTKFIRESVSSLKEAFNAAVTNHLISRNPSSNIVVKNDNLVSERVVMTDEQQMQFLNIAKHRYYNEVYQILLSTGMRIGELTALQWDDIDFENKEIHIRHSMQSAYLNGKKILNMTTPKHLILFVIFRCLTVLKSCLFFGKKNKIKLKKNWVDDGDCLKNLKIWFLQVLWGRH